jgi:hypothetical protein
VDSLSWSSSISLTIERHCIYLQCIAGDLAVQLTASSTSDVLTDADNELVELS